MNNPLFSIIVPVYQSMEYLEETVKSLKDQTFKEIEIILIDDGSTDGSSDLCDRLAAEDKRIKAYHKSNGGAASARNLGIKFSKGKWIIFVDSDDVVSLVMCEAFYSYLRKYPTVDFIAFNFSSADKLEKVVLSKVPVLTLENFTQNIKLIEDMLYSDYNNMPSNFRENFGNNTVLNSPCGKIYNRQFLIQNKIYFKEDIRYSEDLLFNIQLLFFQARGVYLNENVYFYRDNLNSVTKTEYVPYIIENYANFKSHFEEIINCKWIKRLQKSIDTYTIRTSLRVLPADIFISQNSIHQSYLRLKQITQTKAFFKIFNYKSLKESSNKLDIKSRLKSRCLIKRNFFVLIFWYKIMK